jgi:hypothetical protein
VFPGIGVEHGLAFDGGAGDGVVVVVDVLVVVVVPAGVVTGLPDAPGIGCGVVVGAFLLATFTHLCTRM